MLMFHLVVYDVEVLINVCHFTPAMCNWCSCILYCYCVCFFVSGEREAVFLYTGRVINDEIANKLN